MYGLTTLTFFYSRGMYMYNDIFILVQTLLDYTPHSLGIPHSPWLHSLVEQQLEITVWAVLVV